MIPYKKRKSSSRRQYISKKPVKWGFKVLTRCCAKTGLIYNFYIYEGKKSNIICSSPKKARSSDPNDKLIFNKSLNT